MSTAPLLPAHPAPAASAPFRPVATLTAPVAAAPRPDGSLVLRSTAALGPYPARLTERLLHWAAATPDRVFLAQRAPAPPGEFGAWRTLTYAQALDQVQRLASWLLGTGASPERPVVILSENSLEHALLSLAALHVGLPVAVLTPAYALRSTDFAKLRYVLGQLTPGLLFVADGRPYAPALHALAGAVPVLVASGAEALTGLAVQMFGQVLAADMSAADQSAVAEAHARIRPGTVAKILFTSGSTGLPKGVINTHENIAVNWQQITQTFPFMENGGLVLIDWLPWNHTFGGNHNFGLVLYNGGTLYLDEGSPTSTGLAITLANLRECCPTMYCNVPKGFADLLPHLWADVALRTTFFSQLKLLFYAGAGLPQHVWDELEELAVATMGERIVIATGLGCTESSPSALFSARPGGFAGLLGVPVPGFELKLVPHDGKLEARFRGGNVMPGYWRNPAATAAAFDEEGYYRTGDALRLVEAADPNAGLVFDGRLAEDFKLDTGTWVNVGQLRARLLEAGQGLFADAVITGHDRAFVGAIIFPSLTHCRQLTGRPDLALAHADGHPALQAALAAALVALSPAGTGSATRIRKALFADFTPSFDRGEITDKGNLNQRGILANRSDLVARLYA